MSTEKPPDEVPVPGAFDRERFREQLGTTFHVDVDGTQVPLTLARVVDGRAGGGFERFSVLFHGPVEASFAQGTYVFAHDALGAFALFIVPVVGSDAERIVYEACFSNRLPPKP